MVRLLGLALALGSQPLPCVALIYEGYKQGVIGFVNGSGGYKQTVGISRADGKVKAATKQGGLVSVYYFGAMFGCFITGRFGNRYGRKLAVVVGRPFALLGGALQTGSQNSNMTLCARLTAGIGIGVISSVGINL